MSSVYQGNSIFWVEIQKIRPNPFQPRREFDERALRELAESIRQYGILQPLVVTRKEEQRPDGGISVYYELIAGERRLRAAKIAGLEQVPVIIRNDTDDNLRLELAILENLQREDLNPVDRALAFEQLHKQFGLTHTEIGKRMGRSRVYVSNTIRILSLPEEIRLGLISGKITEGHTRPLLMLSDRPEEQKKLYEEIILRKLSVRDAEKIARRIAQDKVRKKKFIVDPRIREYEKRLSENLGTRVHIEQKEKGGKILIDYFSMEDLENILNALKKEEKRGEEGGWNGSPLISSSSHQTREDGGMAQSDDSFKREDMPTWSHKNGVEEDEEDSEQKGFSEDILRFAESHGIELTGGSMRSSQTERESVDDREYIPDEHQQFSFDGERTTTRREGKRYDEKRYHDISFDEIDGRAVHPPSSYEREQDTSWYENAREERAERITEEENISYEYGFYPRREEYRQKDYEFSREDERMRGGRANRYREEYREEREFSYGQGGEVRQGEQMRNQYGDSNPLMSIEREERGLREGYEGRDLHHRMSYRNYFTGREDDSDDSFSDY